MAGSTIVPLHTDLPNQGRLLDPGAAHARFYSGWRHLDAFKTLSLLQRVILQDELMNYSKVIGNEVRLTATGIMNTHKVGRAKARTAIAGLEERGWIQRIRLGPGPTGQAGGVYELLCLDARGRRISGPYMQWTQPRPDKPVRPSQESN